MNRTSLLPKIARELATPEAVLACIRANHVVAAKTSTAHVPPRNPVEKKLCEIWTSILTCDVVGVEDSFFELGGHSLLVARMLSRVHSSFGIELPLHTFFDNPTISSMATRLAETLAAALRSGARKDFIKSTQSDTAGHQVARTAEAFGVEDRYRSTDVEVRQLTDSKFVAKSSGPHPAVLIDDFEWSVLRGCGQFSTTNEHAVRITQQLKAPKERVLKSLLKLQSKSLLSSERELHSKLRAPSVTPDRAKIEHFAITTCDRPEALYRCLESYASHFEKHERNVTYIVSDDSRNETSLAKNVSLLEEIAKKKKLVVNYFGPREKKTLFQLAVQGGIEPRVADFALFGDARSGQRPGANRNAVLLASAGKVILSADDDTICEIKSPEEQQQDVSFVSAVDPADYWFHNNRSSALNSIASRDTDLLTVHERLLGTNFGNPRWTSAPKLDLANWQLLGRILHPESHVAITFTGLVGDCGWGTPLNFFLMSDRSLARLTTSGRVYSEAQRSREVVRVTPGPIISDDSFCMTYAFALDNRQVLAPFLPVKRGEDIVFGSTLWHIFPHSLFGHVGAAIVHAPIEKRRFLEGEILRAASGFDLSSLIQLCIRSCPGSSAKIDQRRMDLATYLFELATLPSDLFCDRIWRLYLEDRGRLISRLSVVLGANASAPANWRRDLQRFINIMEQTLEAADAIVPQDLLEESVRTEERQVIAQQMMARFAELLRAWPHFHELARSSATSATRVLA